MKVFLTALTCLTVLGLFLAKDRKETFRGLFTDHREVRDWGALEMPEKDASLQLQTRFRDGRLYYKFAVSPFESFAEIFRKMRADSEYRLLDQYFNIKFMDEYGFLVKQIRIRLNELTDVVGKDGRRNMLMATSSIECRSGDYRAMAYHNIAWALDSDLLADRQVSRAGG